MTSLELQLLFSILLPISCANIVPQDDVTVVSAATPASSSRSVYTSVLSADASNFVEAVVETFSVMLVSELGDNTFLIAAIMAMKYPRMVVFLGAMSALVLMTFVSILCGWAVSAVPKIYLYYCSLVVMWTFGVKMIVDGFRLPERDEPSGEDTKVLVEKSETLADEDEATLTSEELKLMDDPELGAYEMDGAADAPGATFSRIFAEAFTITFVGEWGDRSQLATMVLTWNDNKCGIMLGSFLCHCMTTGLAVVGGRFVAGKIPVRKVSLVGGVVFILSSFIIFFKNNDLPFS